MVENMMILCHKIKILSSLYDNILSFLHSEHLEIRKILNNARYIYNGGMA